MITDEAYIITIKGEKNMKLKEILEMFEDEYDDYEVYTPNTSWDEYQCAWRFHSDAIRSIEDYDLVNSEVIHYELMDEEDYDKSICANSCVRADFAEWYDNKDAKVLVILVDTY